MHIESSIDILEPNFPNTNRSLLFSLWYDLFSLKKRYEKGAKSKLADFCCTFPVINSVQVQKPSFKKAKDLRSNNSGI